MDLSARYADRVKIVKYEDLCVNTEYEVKKLFFSVKSTSHFLHMTLSGNHKNIQLMIRILFIEIEI